MITGKIVNNQEATIELEVVGVDRLEKIEAIIDTGFTGELMLSGDLIDRLEIPRVGELPITLLGDGSEVYVSLYLTIVVWHSEKRIVQILRTDGNSLVGMSLLFGNRLILDVVTDGEVSIEILP